MDLSKELEKLGLSPKESVIYVALLELGEATPQHLCQKTGLNRATTYVILDSLLKKDLVRKFSRQHKTLFMLKAPLQLLELLYAEKKAVSEKIEIAKQVMPELEMLSRLTTDRAKVKFFEGKEGIAMIQDEVSNPHIKRVDTIFNINLAVRDFPPSPHDHRQRLKNLKRKSRQIVVYNPKISIPDLRILKYTERRYLPFNKYPFNVDFCLYDHKVALVAAKTKLIGVVIENADIVEGMRSLFELAWHGAANYAVVGKQKSKKALL